MLFKNFTKNCNTAKKCTSERWLFRGKMRAFTVFLEDVVSHSEIWFANTRDSVRVAGGLDCRGGGSQFSHNMLNFSAILMMIIEHTGVSNLSSFTSM